MKLAALKESGLSRLQSKVQAGVAGAITAYRSEYTRRENQQRNRSLLAKLQSSGFSVTAIKGSYIENYGSEDQREVSEHSYFVSPHGDGSADRLEAMLVSLGQEFDQDSVLVVSNGKAALIGTSHRENAWPSYGSREPVGGFKGGKAAEFMSRVNNRSFVFEDYEMPGTINGIRGLKILASKPWQEIEGEGIDKL